MSSKRKTFHVDWDSPSHETGTVKRRPASLSATFSTSVDYFENVEYYEVKDCAGGYNLELLRSFDSRYEDVPEFLPGESPSNETASAAIKDNGNDSEHPPSRGVARKKDTRLDEDDDPEGFHDSIAVEGQAVEDRESNRDSIRVMSIHGDRPIFQELEEERTLSLVVEKRSADLLNKEDPGSRVVERKVEEEAEVIVGNIDFHDSASGVEEAKESAGTSDLAKKDSRLEVRREFGLKLCREPLEWRSKASRITKIVGSSRRVDCSKKKSFIPRPKMIRSASGNRGLVNSSSESSGIGSPLSPLSPLKDASGNTKDDPREFMKSSESKSSGLGSPDSPLSPESQKYAAFYLIQEQLDKLRRCPCEKRQAQGASSTVLHFCRESREGYGAHRTIQAATKSSTRCFALPLDGGAGAKGFLSGISSPSGFRIALEHCS
ncbi:hypothetical protein KM043_015437 [Ampulex compressa]|nr:hypothetical protein KM043_015437 [Ampulex compressa]